MEAAIVKMHEIYSLVWLKQRAIARQYGITQSRVDLRVIRHLLRRQLLL